MSLTSHLENPEKSLIGRFLRQRLASTTSLTKTANQHLRQKNIFLPATHPWPYSTLGMAIDYRIRYSFAITPHHKLVAWQGAYMLLNFDDRMQMGLKSLEQWGHAQLPLPPTQTETGPFYRLDVIDGFFQALHTALERLQPVGRRLMNEEEQELARYCFLLGLFEEPFRSSRYRDGILMQPVPRQSIQELLALPQAAWIEDLCTLSQLFYEKGHHLLSRPHVLNPTFAGSHDVGGADADFIVDDCLIDIKTTKQKGIEADWLRQLAGYLLLDYDDRYHIQCVGLYMARQGELLIWSAEAFLQALCADTSVSLASLRRDFRVVVEQQKAIQSRRV